MHLHSPALHKLQTQFRPGAWLLTAPVPLYPLSPYQMPIHTLLILNPSLPQAIPSSSPPASLLPVFLHSLPSRSFSNFQNVIWLVSFQAFYSRTSDPPPQKPTSLLLLPREQFCPFSSTTDVFSLLNNAYHILKGAEEEANNISMGLGGHKGKAPLHILS